MLPECATDERSGITRDIGDHTIPSLEYSVPDSSQFRRDQQAEKDSK